MRQDDVPAEKPFARECGARTIDAAARVGHRRRRAARAPAKPVVRAGVGPAKVRRRRGRIATWSRRRGPTRVEAVLVALRTTAATCAVRGRRRKLRPEPIFGRRLGTPRRLRRAVFGIRDMVLASSALRFQSLSWHREGDYYVSMNTVKWSDLGEPRRVLQLDRRVLEADDGAVGVAGPLLLVVEQLLEREEIVHGREE